MTELELNGASVSPSDVGFDRHGLPYCLTEKNVTAFPLACPQVFARQVENFLGSDVIDPVLQFPPGTPPDGFDAPPLEFDSWSEISEVCGDSRIWGGLHFAVSSGRSLLLGAGWGGCFTEFGSLPTLFSG